MEEVEAAAKAANASDFLNTMPQARILDGRNVTCKLFCPLAGWMAAQTAQVIGVCNTRSNLNDLGPE